MTDWVASSHCYSWLFLVSFIEKFRFISIRQPRLQRNCSSKLQLSSIIKVLLEAVAIKLYPIFVSLSFFRCIMTLV